MASAGPFRQLPDGTASASHSGTISQDDVGEVFTVTGANVGAVPTNGTFQVQLVPPNGATIVQRAGDQ